MSTAAPTRIEQGQPESAGTRSALLTATVLATGCAILYLALAPVVDAQKSAHTYSLPGIYFAPEKGSTGTDFMRPARLLGRHFPPYLRYCQLFYGVPQVMPL